MYVRRRGWMPRGLLLTLKYFKWLSKSYLSLFTLTTGLIPISVKFRSNDPNFAYNNVQHLLWKKSLYRLTTFLYVVVSCCMKFARDQKCLYNKCCVIEHLFCFQRCCMLLLSFDHLPKLCCVRACAVGF